MAVLFAVRWPTELLEAGDLLNKALNLVIWSSFLLLVSILFASLTEIRERRVALATEELLEEYLRRSMAGRQDHTARVAQLAGAIGRQMHLPAAQVAILETAAHLHGLQAAEHGLQLISDSLAKGLSDNKKFGAALPILLAGQTEPAPAGKPEVTIGSKILSVADAFETIAADCSSVAPLQLLTDMEREEKYDRAVTSALRRLLQRGPEQPNPAPA